MPLQQMVPTWLALNNCNFTSPSGITDLRTQQPFPAGGLNLGDYFDLTGLEAASMSYATNGLLYSGRYRLVQVSAGATAANVKAGTVGYMAPGGIVQGVYQLAAGSGMTPGTYIVTTAGGGTGAVQATIQVLVLTATTIATPVVLTPGSGFTSLPTATLTGTGGTPATLTVQMNTTPNIVTSADVAATAGISFIRPVVFLNSITPGNYGFVQELGVATVLAAATTVQAVNQFAIATATGSTPIGLMIASSATYSYNAIGWVIDPVSSSTAITPFKVLLNGPVVQD